MSRGGLGKPVDRAFAPAINAVWQPKRTTGSMRLPTLEKSWMSDRLVHRLTRAARVPAWAILVLWMMPGCALNRQGDREISDLLARHQLERSPQADSYGSLPRRKSDTAPSPGVTPAGALREEPALASLIRIALDQNPDLQSAIETAHGLASRIPQVTALPDPILSTKTFPEPVRTAEGDNFFILGIRQKLPVPEKLDRRGRIALEEVRMAIEAVEQTKLRVIADVKRAYFQLFAIDQSISITEENKDLLRDLIEVTRGKFIVNKRQQADVLRAQVELSNLESELVALRQRRTTVVSLLNALLNRAYETPIETPPEYDVRRVDLRLRELLARAFENNPELQRLHRQIARDEQGVQLARLEYWPDFTLGFEWMQMDPRGAFRPPINPQTGRRPRVSQLSEDGSDNWAITFGLNLPIWFERIEAGIREAEHKLSASRLQHTSVKNLVAFRVQDALARVESFRDIAQLFATSIIPQAEQAYQVSRAGYIAGTSDFQYVIDNWQKWLLFRIQYYQTLGELERSVADLEQVAGVSIIDARAPATGSNPATQRREPVSPNEE